VTGIDRRSALIAAAGSLALAGRAHAGARPASDRHTLEQLLSLERELESAYDAAARRAVLGDGTAELLRDHEREHAQGLERTLAGGDRAPVATVPSPVLARALQGGERPFLRYALGLESRAVAAYADAVTNLRDATLLQPLGSIMAGEGQHLVLLRRALGVRPASVALEDGHQNRARRE
jgi:Ferritin-like domain